MLFPCVTTSVCGNAQSRVTVYRPGRSLNLMLPFGPVVTVATGTPDSVVTVMTACASAAGVGAGAETGLTPSYGSGSRSTDAIAPDSPPRAVPFKRRGAGRYRTSP